MYSNQTSKAEANIQKLINEGWKIVSTSPITKSVIQKSSSIFRDCPRGDLAHFDYTNAIIVFLVKE
jgi:hypothetical protein